MNCFCTLFDSGYLSRGLVMYQSLLATGCRFQLYVYAFDDECARVLEQLALPHVTVVTLKEFENERLLEVKPTRSRGEYCWTCASHVIAHALDTFGCPEMTYLDADLFFYASPAILLSELDESGGSILLSPHRYTPRYDYLDLCGRYCVQFMTFKSDDRGRSALTWWQDRTLEWCYDRKENGLFGDQKYLDDWPERFPGVHLLQHLGGGVAPWNVQQYTLGSWEGRLHVDEVPLVFYHFHGYKFYGDGSHNLGDYRLSGQVVDQLYRPYAAAVRLAESHIRSYSDQSSGCSEWNRSLRAAIGRVIRRLKGEYNVYTGL